jgi:hypothetical protein
MHEHESNKSCQCEVCKVRYFERNNYYHGKMLNARDLAAEQYYFNEKRWLINRTVIGWGIVCGLEVSLQNGCLVVARGLALDCCGHELLLCDPHTLHADKVAEALGIKSDQPSEEVRWALCLEYCECKTEPVDHGSSCNEERGRDYNRIRDDYRLSIRPFDDACPEDHNDDCCPYEGLGRETSIHQALVQRSRRCPKCKDCECVLLATGTIKTYPGRGSEITLDDDYWKYRRIVYTNPALASLVRCFHGGLAHITEINWKPGTHYDVDDFLYLLSKEHLKVTFDQPMNQYTVRNSRSFRLSLFISIGDGTCPVQYLIPVERIEYDDDTAVYYFESDCLEHELRASCKKLRKAAEVELVLHGSMVLDKKGRALDAELIGDFPTGNGVEGGEFITYFTVGP